MTTEEITPIPPSPSLGSGFQITPTGAVATGVLAKKYFDTAEESRAAYERWLDDTAYAIEVWASLPLAIGDMLVYGEERWPEEFAQVIDGFSQRYDIQTLRNYASVCRRVRPELRHPGLSFSHYDAVAALPPAQQEELLKRTVDKNLSREGLRQLVRNIRGVQPVHRFQFHARKITVEIRPGGVKCFVCEDVLPLSESGEIPTGEVDVHIMDYVDLE